jgi:hypothetical protein
LSTYIESSGTFDFRSTPMLATAPPIHNRIAGHFAPAPIPVPATPEGKQAARGDALFTVALFYQVRLTHPDLEVAEHEARAISNLEMTRVCHAAEDDAARPAPAAAGLFTDQREVASSLAMHAEASANRTGADGVDAEGTSRNRRLRSDGEVSAAAGRNKGEVDGAGGGIRRRIGTFGGRSPAPA